MVVDTHAGAGLYRLDGDYAETSGESVEGYKKLVQSQLQSQNTAKTANKNTDKNITKKEAVAIVPTAQEAIKNIAKSSKNTTPAALAPLLQNYLAAVAEFN
ncbi:MAG: hypothetical protein RJB10_1577, partial [Pseudomonadota bacterium]